MDRLIQALKYGGQLAVGRVLGSLLGGAAVDREKSMFDAVAAATSLADLKTRYSAITQIPQRSLADLVAAIKTALAATPE